MNIELNNKKLLETLNIPDTETASYVAMLVLCADELGIEVVDRVYEKFNPLKSFKQS